MRGFLVYFMIHNLKSFLDEKHNQYNCIDFIEQDPIIIPHAFAKKEDIEISGFFAATLAWGQRKTIINNANKLMLWMDNSPHQFILNSSAKDWKPFSKFIHRTFNGEDCITFIKCLQHIYKNKNGLESVFTKELLIENDMSKCISNFKKVFFEKNNHTRTSKHVADPLRNSSAKRICMYLRWMVRNDNNGVDFGIWKTIKPSQLYCPLDVHSARAAIALQLLNRTQTDWKAVNELTCSLRLLDESDPVKYDFALFGLSAYEGFK